MKNAKQKQRGIVGSGGKLINHGDTEITKRGKRKLETGEWKEDSRGDAGSAETQVNTEFFDRIEAQLRTTAEGSPARVRCSRINLQD